VKIRVVTTDGREKKDIAGDADTVDDFHAAATPTANKLLALNADAKFPTHTIEGDLTVEGGFNVGTTGAGPGDIALSDDILLADGAVVGIAGNEVITFNAAGIIAVTGANFTVAGNVGIGTTADYRLNVVANQAAAYAAVFWNDGNNNDRYGIGVLCGKDDASGDNEILVAYDGDATIEGYLTIDNGTFELNQGSDERRKKDIVPAGAMLARLRQVGISEFSFREKAPGVRHTGYMAQQLHEFFPQIAKHNKRTDWWGVAVTRMIPINTKGIQELDSYRLDADAERETIRAEIAGLQERLAVLEL